MTKYLVSALAIALVGAAIASIAQSAPMDHPSHGMGVQGMMEMESPALMAEQQKLMMQKRT